MTLLNIPVEAHPVTLTASTSSTTRPAIVRGMSFSFSVGQTSVYDADCDATSFGGIGHAHRQRSSLSADCRPSGPVLE